MQKNIISKFSLYIILALNILYPSYGIANAPKRPHYKKDYKHEKLVDCKTQVCRPFRVITTLTGGAGFTQAGRTQSFIDNDITYSYHANKSGLSRIMWGAAAGGEFNFNSGWAADVTIGYSQIATFEAKGIGTQGSTVYNYQYSVNSKQYLLEAKILNGVPYGLHAYGLLGVGAAFNMLGNYTTTPAAVVGAPEYQSKTNSNFAYSIGLGFDYDISHYMRMGLGYKFIGLGQANLGTGTVGTTVLSKTIKQNALNEQEVMVQITFLV